MKKLVKRLKQVVKEAKNENATISINVHPDIMRRTEFLEEFTEEYGEPSVFGSADDVRWASFGKRKEITVFL